MKIFLGILAGVVLTFVGLIAFSMYMTQPSNQPTSGFDVQTEEDVFVSSCMGEGASREYCECAYNGIVDDYGDDVWNDIAGMTDDELMDLLLPYIIGCEDSSYQIH